MRDHGYHQTATEAMASQPTQPRTNVTESISRIHKAGLETLARIDAAGQRVSSSPKKDSCGTPQVPSSGLLDDADDAALRAELILRRLDALLTALGI
jgi:hypothetical protein